jgi:ketosteroid isomerase-like protein
MATTAEQTTIEAMAARYGEAWNSQDLDAILAHDAVTLLQQLGWKP